MITVNPYIYRRRLTAIETILERGEFDGVSVADLRDVIDGVTLLQKDGLVAIVQGTVWFTVDPETLYGLYPELHYQPLPHVSVDLKGLQVDQRVEVKSILSQFARDGVVTPLEGDGMGYEIMTLRPDLVYNLLVGVIKRDVKRVKITRRKVERGDS